VRSAVQHRGLAGDRLPAFNRYIDILAQPLDGVADPPGPLEDVTDSGIVRFHEDAEPILSKFPRRGISLILREVREGITSFSHSVNAEDCPNVAHRRTRDER